MNPSLWTTCMRWERFSPTTTARIQASFSSTGRSTERSRERHYETRGSNPPFVRAWETSSRLVHGRPSRSDPRMIVAAASQAQRSSDFIMGTEHKESLQECQTSLEGSRLPGRGSRALTRGFPALLTTIRTATGFQPSWNGSMAPIQGTGSPGHTGNACRYEKPESYPAQLGAPAR
jgi:hypothetical protein